MIVSFIYFISYVFLSSNGFYKSRILTISKKSDSHMILVPNKTFEKWEPFPLFQENTRRPTLKHLFFYPLVILDQWIFHPDP